VKPASLSCGLAVFLLVVAAIFNPHSSSDGIVIENQTVDVVTHAGIKARFFVSLKNSSDSPIEITSCDSSCSCVLTSDFPETISPGSTKRIPFEVTGQSFPPHSSLRYELKFYSNPPQLGLLVVVNVKN
jgi:hypothetical protein